MNIGLTDSTVRENGGRIRENHFSILPMQGPRQQDVTSFRENRENFSTSYTCAGARARSRRPGGESSLFSLFSLFRGTHRCAGAAATGNRAPRSNARANALTARRCGRRSDGATLPRTGARCDAGTDGAALSRSNASFDGLTLVPTSQRLTLVRTLERFDARKHAGTVGRSNARCSARRSLGHRSASRSFALAQRSTLARSAGRLDAQTNAKTLPRSCARGSAWRSRSRSDVMTFGQTQDVRTNRSAACRAAASFGCGINGSFPGRLEADAPGNSRRRLETEFSVSGFSRGALQGRSRGAVE